MENTTYQFTEADRKAISSYINVMYPDLKPKARRTKGWDICDEIIRLIDRYGNGCGDYEEGGYKEKGMTLVEYWLSHL